MGAKRLPLRKISPTLRPRREEKLITPMPIDAAAFEWFALRVAAGCERRVATEVAEHGVKAYCPLAARFVNWCPRRSGSRRRIIRQFPVFSRYIFVGLGPRQNVIPSRRWNERIEAVLSDSHGPLRVPSAAIAAINAWEIAGQWDETKGWDEKTPFQPGVEVQVMQGPFAGFGATVEAIEAEGRIRVLATLFGRRTRLHVDADQLELANARNLA